jgi:hypothetical protein
MSASSSRAIQPSVIRSASATLLYGYNKTANGVRQARRDRCLDERLRSS